MCVLGRLRRPLRRKNTTSSRVAVAVTWSPLQNVVLAIAAAAAGTARLSVRRHGALIGRRNALPGARRTRLGAAQPPGAMENIYQYINIH